MKADIWMPLYVADYLADTNRLTTIQHGAYLLLIMDYWRNGPLPNDDSVLAQVTKLSPDAWCIARAVLEQFFSISESTWTHKRIDAELKTASTNKEVAHTRAVIAAKARWDKENKLKEDATSNAQAVLKQCPSPSPSPVLKTKEANASPVSPSAKPTEAEKLTCPIEDIVSLYHQYMPLNPKAKILNNARKKTISARWREAAALDVSPFGYNTREKGLESWAKFFSICAESEFLTGRSPAQPGRPPFIADIDFIFSPSGFAKTLENKYHREAS